MVILLQTYFIRKSSIHLARNKSTVNLHNKQKEDTTILLRNISFLFSKIRRSVFGGHDILLSVVTECGNLYTEIE